MKSPLVLNTLSLLLLLLPLLYLHHIHYLRLLHSRLLPFFSSSSRRLLHLRLHPHFLHLRRHHKTAMATKNIIVTGASRGKYAGPVPRYHFVIPSCVKTRNQATNALASLHRHRPCYRDIPTLASLFLRCSPRRPHGRPSPRIFVSTPGPGVLCVRRRIFRYDRKEHRPQSSPRERPAVSIFEVQNHCFEQKSES